MTPDQIQASKFLSRVLRHRPDSIGIRLDRNGWVSIDELLTQASKFGISLSREELHYIVEHNDKKRFSFDLI